MNYLITGGTGFIGQAMCKDLLAKGHHVVVLTRSKQKVFDVFQDRVAAIESLVDIPATQQPEVIINLAGQNLASKRWTKSLKKEFVSSRVDVTSQVINYIQQCQNKPKVLISGSAVGFYGAQGDNILTEQSAAHSEYQSVLCQQWEEKAFEGTKEGVRVCTIRTGIVLGAGGGALRSMLPPFRFGMGAYLGSGKQWMSWIHIEDWVRIANFIVETESIQGPINGTSPNPVTNKYFSKALGKAIHRPVLFFSPRWVIKCLVGEMAHLLLTGQRVVPRALEEADFEFKYPELEQAFKEVLG